MVSPIKRRGGSVRVAAEIGELADVLRYYHTMSDVATKMFVKETPDAVLGGIIGLYKTYMAGEVHDGDANDPHYQLTPLHHIFEWSKQGMEEGLLPRLTFPGRKATRSAWDTVSQIVWGQSTEPVPAAARDGYRGEDHVFADKAYVMEHQAGALLIPQNSGVLTWNNGDMFNYGPMYVSYKFQNQKFTESFKALFNSTTVDKAIASWYDKGNEVLASRANASPGVSRIAGAGAPGMSDHGSKFSKASVTRKSKKAASDAHKAGAVIAKEALKHV